MIEIPQITDPLGASWIQPTPDQFAVYDDIAIMDRDALALLPEYSASIPTGVYDGKMWKCKNGEDWLLCWYGPHEDPKQVTINRRPIRILRSN